MNKCRQDRRGDGRSARAGQAMMEFLLVASAVLALTAIMAVLLFSTREYGGRVLDLIASEYP